MSGVKKVLQGLGALGQVVCDMGFSACTVSIVNTFCMVFFFQKQVCLYKNKKFMLPFVFMRVAQFTAYRIQYPADSEKKGKALKKC